MEIKEIKKNRRAYSTIKSIHKESMMYEINEDTQSITEVYCDTRREYLRSIKENSTSVLFESKNSFERVIALIETFEKNEVEYVNFRSEFVLFINKMVAHHSEENGVEQVVEYLLVKDIFDDVFANLVKKVGWENIFSISGVEYAEALLIDHRWDEYELTVLDGKEDLANSIDEIILSIEENTDFFEGNNDEINAMIDETLDKIAI